MSYSLLTVRSSPPFTQKFFKEVQIKLWKGKLFFFSFRRNYQEGTYYSYEKMHEKLYEHQVFF